MPLTTGYVNQVASTDFSIAFTGTWAAPAATVTVSDSSTWATVLNQANLQSYGVYTWTAFESLKGTAGYNNLIAAYVNLAPTVNSPLDLFSPLDGASILVNAPTTQYVKVLSQTTTKQKYLGGVTTGLLVSGVANPEALTSTLTGTDTGYQVVFFPNPSVGIGGVTSALTLIVANDGTKTRADAAQLAIDIKNASLLIPASGTVPN
jgi:hypothetical protein